MHIFERRRCRECFTKNAAGMVALQATTPAFETIVSTVRLGSGRRSWTVFCVHSGRFPRISTPLFLSHPAIPPFHIPASPWFRRVPACVATFVASSIPRTWLATPIHVTRRIHLFRTHRSGSILDLLDIHFPFKTGFHGDYWKTHVRRGTKQTRPIGGRASVQQPRHAGGEVRERDPGRRKAWDGKRMEADVDRNPAFRRTGRSNAEKRTCGRPNTCLKGTSW